MPGAKAYTGGRPFMPGAKAYTGGRPFILRHETCTHDLIAAQLLAR